MTDPAERRELTDTEIYEGDLEAGTDPMRSGLRSDETDDPNVAAEEGLAYVPPTDPPVTGKGMSEQRRCRALCIRMCR